LNLKKNFFLLRKTDSLRGWEYPNPLGMGMRFNFSSLLDMGRVMGKYMGVGDGEDKTHPHPAPLPCLAEASGC